MAQVSKRYLNKKLKDKLYANLLTVLAEITNKPAANEVLNTFFSQTERTMLLKRLAIALLLREGHTYQEIMDTLKVSPPTINKISQQMKRNRKLFSKLTRHLIPLKLDGRE